MENEMERSTIAFSFILSFLAGIFVASFSITLGIAAAIAAIFAFFWVVILGMKHPKVLFSVTAVFFLGTFYFHAWGAAKNEFSTFPASSDDFTAVAVSEPSVSNGQYSFDAKLRDPFHGTIKVLTYQGENISYGDLLKLKGERVGSKVPFEALYKAKESIVLKSHQASAFRESLIGFKNRVARAANEYFTAREASLLNGMIIGKQGDFDPTLKKEMSLSGTTHLVALSGYNVGILVWCVFLVLASFLSRRWVAVCSIIIIVLFVAMVGAQASVVRAAIMAFFLIATQTLGRPHAAGGSILLAAFLMALADPRILGFDIGFQLSFLSLLGIVYLHEPILRLFRKKRENSSDPIPAWKENFITTCAAQLGVLPLLLYYFGQFSFLAIISNILILQLVPLTMFFGFCIAVAGLLFKFLPIIFILPASVLLRFELAVIHLFSSIRLPLPSAIFSGGVSIVIYYALLVFFILYQRAGPSQPRRVYLEHV
jgi:competence protein ComEC